MAGDPPVASNRAINSSRRPPWAIPTDPQIRCRVGLVSSDNTTSAVADRDRDSFRRITAALRRSTFDMSRRSTTDRSSSRLSADRIVGFMRAATPCVRRRRMPRRRRRPRPKENSKLPRWPTRSANDVTREDVVPERGSSPSAQSIRNHQAAATPVYPALLRDTTRGPVGRPVTAGIRLQAALRKSPRSRTPASWGWAIMPEAAASQALVAHAASRPPAAPAGAVPRHRMQSHVGHPRRNHRAARRLRAARPSRPTLSSKDDDGSGTTSTKRNFDRAGRGSWPRHAEYTYTSFVHEICGPR